MLGVILGEVFAFIEKKQVLVVSTASLRHNMTYAIVVIMLSMSSSFASLHRPTLVAGHV